MGGGFGCVGFGRYAYGQAISEYEPRFFESTPSDGATGILIYEVVIRFSLYCFSSAVQWESGSGLLIEVSEDSGVLYADAFANGVFVAPYNGSYSKIDPQQGDPQEFGVCIHKTSNWPAEQEIRVRVTAYDEYGEEATKETVIEW